MPPFLPYSSNYKMQLLHDFYYQLSHFLIIQLKTEQFFLKISDTSNLLAPEVERQHQLARADYYGCGEAILLKLLKSYSHQSKDKLFQVF